MNLKEIVKEYLEKNEYDGLFNGDVECACSLDDLMPCDEPHQANCRAGINCNHCKGDIEHCNSHMNGFEECECIGDRESVLKEREELNKVIQFPSVQVLTEEAFSALPDGEIFARGEIEDSEVGINMTTSKRMLRWIATKGFAQDWAVYCHFSDEADEEFVKIEGQKVGMEVHIRKLVPCSDEVFKKYRY